MTFLHWIGDVLRAQLDQVPLSTARWLFIGLYLVLILWIAQMPSARAVPHEKQPKWYQDLRIWTWLTLLAQVVIYSVF